MKKELPITRELELAANRARQKRLGFEQPILSQRQKRRLKLKAKKYWLELTALSWFVIALMADAVWWVPLLVISWGLVIGLYRWRNRDIAKGNELVRRQIQKKKPASDTNTDRQMGRAD